MAAAATRLPANKNVKWGLSLSLWGHFPRGPFTDILDIMRDTGFTGIRLTGYPGFLKTYDLTPAIIERETSKRNVQVITISFNGPAQDAAQQSKVIQDARTAMTFLKSLGARHLVVFSPSRKLAGADTEDGFKIMCQTFNRIGEAAGEMGLKAGLHNHLSQMVETPAEVHKCMAMTDPKLFHFSPDTAHLHLGGGNVVELFERYKSRLMFCDYKDAHWTTPADAAGKARFTESIFDLGDGDVDFPGCHRVLKAIGYKSWICVDLDTARKGPRVSYERCGEYVVRKLEPIYV